jgi:hypothetical protein
MPAHFRSIFLGLGALGAIVLAAGGLDSHAAADCAATHAVPALLTPITAAMPQSSGALVAGFRSERGTGALSFDGVRMTRRRTSVSMQPIEIAPGLVRLVPSTVVRPGAYSLEGLGAPTELTVGRSPMPGAPVRPAVSGVRRVASATSGRGLSVELRATLGFAVPTGIVAILGYWGDASTPSVWSRAVVGQTEVVLFASPDHCATLPPGFTPPPAEGPLSVRIAYVDQFGQVSPISDPTPVE